MYKTIRKSNYKHKKDINTLIKQINNKQLPPEQKTKLEADLHELKHEGLILSSELTPTLYKNSIQQIHEKLDSKLENIKKLTILAINAETLYEDLISQLKPLLPSSNALLNTCVNILNQRIETIDCFLKSKWWHFHRYTDLSSEGKTSIAMLQEKVFLIQGLLALKSALEKLNSPIKSNRFLNERTLGSDTQEEAVCKTDVYPDDLLTANERHYIKTCQEIFSKNAKTMTSITRSQATNKAHQLLGVFYVLLITALVTTLYSSLLSTLFFIGSLLISKEYIKNTYLSQDYENTTFLAASSNLYAFYTTQNPSSSSKTTSLEDRTDSPLTRFS